jgi:hypothetical protein
MLRARVLVAVGVFLLVAGAAAAAEDALPLLTAHGTIDKVEKSTLTIRPRGPDGKFEKSLALKLTGSSTVSTLSIQKRAGKAVVVQKETQPKDLHAGQAAAVIYTMGPDGAVLLSAVVQPPAEK